MAGSRPNGSVAVLPITHPDATAFAARFLADPADRLGRLVFADWLEEQGGEANELWARYLRYMAHAEEDFDGLFRQRAESLGRTVRARLTLATFPDSPLLPWLNAFLPDHRIWVKFDEPVEIFHQLGAGGLQLGPFAWGLIPHAQIREFSVLPLGQIDNRLYALTACQHIQHVVVRDELSRAYGGECVLFRGWLEVIQSVITRRYSVRQVGGVGDLLRNENVVP